MATDIEKLIETVKHLSAEDRQRLRRALVSVASNDDHEAEDVDYQTTLVGAGLLSSVRPRQRDQHAFERFEPVPMSGRPLSETIIEERR